MGDPLQDAHEAVIQSHGEVVKERNALRQRVEQLEAEVAAATEKLERLSVQPQVML